MTLPGLPTHRREAAGDPLGPVAIANLIGTYTALGLAVPGAFSFEGDGYSGVVSPEPHGVCNFAVVTKATPFGATELARLAGDSPAFCVYAVTDPKTNPTEAKRTAETFRRAGFGEPVVQSVMAREPCPAAPEPSLLEVKAYAERHELAAFLARVFFEFGPEEFRAVLGQATADGEGARLFAWREGEETLGGAMASAAGGAWGLYDIAVRETSRRRGIGRRLVEAVAALAPFGSEAVSLQCHRPMTPWYAGMGFRPLAEMTTLRLIRRR